MGSWPSGRGIGDDNRQLASARRQEKQSSHRDQGRDGTGSGQERPFEALQSHADDPATPFEETLDAYDRLIKQGKVRAIGASNYSAARLREALQVSKENGLPRYESLQPLYNLYDRAPYEAELEPLCVEEGLGVIPYFSLASGFLTGKYRSETDASKGARGPMVKKYLDERGLRILQALDEVAREYKSTHAQVAQPATESGSDRTAQRRKCSGAGIAPSHRLRAEVARNSVES
jgi:hypothetical protein